MVKPWALPAIRQNWLMLSSLMPYLAPPFQLSLSLGVEVHDGPQSVARLLPVIWSALQTEGQHQLPTNPNSTHLGYLPGVLIRWFLYLDSRIFSIKINFPRTYFSDKISRRTMSQATGWLKLILAPEIFLLNFRGWTWEIFLQKILASARNQTPCLLSENFTCYPFHSEGAPLTSSTTKRDFCQTAI